MYIKVFALLFALSFSQFAFSCSCPTLKKLNSDDLKGDVEVFTGRVIKVEKKLNSHEVVATFAVTERIYGKESLSEYSVTTSADGGMCGLDFAVGEEWYVFADNSDGNLAAYLCGRSAQLSKRSYPKEMFTANQLKSVRKSQKKDGQRVRQDVRLIKSISKRMERESRKIDIM